MTVQIPGLGVGATTDDIETPTTNLLKALSLGTDGLGKAGGFSAAFTGPPDSVSVIEAGATAAAKWWSVAIAGGAVVSGGAIRTFWDSLGTTNQPNALLALGLVFSAAGLGISYLLGSDVRGRAAASVATIEARQSVAVAMLEEAGKAYRPPADQGPSMPLAGMNVKNNAKAAADRDGWKAIAMQQKGGDIKFLLVKAAETKWVEESRVEFI